MCERRMLNNENVDAIFFCKCAFYVISYNYNNMSLSKYILALSLNILYSNAFRIFIYFNDF